MHKLVTLLSILTVGLALTCPLQAVTSGYVVSPPAKALVETSVRDEVVNFKVTVPYAIGFVPVISFEKLTSSIFSMDTTCTNFIAEDLKGLGFGDFTYQDSAGDLPVVGPYPGNGHSGFWTRAAPSCHQVEYTASLTMSEVMMCSGLKKLHSFDANEQKAAFTAALYVTMVAPRSTEDTEGVQFVTKQEFTISAEPSLNSANWSPANHALNSPVISARLMSNGQIQGTIRTSGSGGICAPVLIENGNPIGLELSEPLHCDCSLCGAEKVVNFVSSEAYCGSAGELELAATELDCTQEKCGLRAINGVRAKIHKTDDLGVRSQSGAGSLYARVGKGASGLIVIATDLTGNPVDTVAVRVCELSEDVKNTAVDVNGCASHSFGTRYRTQVNEWTIVNAPARGVAIVSTATTEVAVTFDLEQVQVVQDYNTWATGHTQDPDFVAETPEPSPGSPEGGEPSVDPNTPSEEEEGVRGLAMGALALAALVALF